MKLLSELFELYYLPWNTFWAGFLFGALWIIWLDWRRDKKTYGRGGDAVRPY